MGHGMRARDLLAELRGRGVKLEASPDGERLRYRPRSAVGPELLDQLKEQKPELLRLLEGERRKLEEPDWRGLVIKFAREPGWIALYDPTCREWHEVRAAECPPSILEDAKSYHRRKRAR
jgi:TubC N-terminal docking domain